MPRWYPTRVPCSAQWIGLRGRGLGFDGQLWSHPRSPSRSPSWCRRAAADRGRVARLRVPAAQTPGPGGASSPPTGSEQVRLRFFPQVITDPFAGNVPAIVFLAPDGWQYQAQVQWLPGVEPHCLPPDASERPRLRGHRGVAADPGLHLVHGAGGLRGADRGQLPGQGVRAARHRSRRSSSPTSGCRDRWPTSRDRSWSTSTRSRGSPRSSRRRSAARPKPRRTGCATSTP